MSDTRFLDSPTIGVCPIDDGTQVRRASRPPGPLGRDSKDVTAMPLEDRFQEVLTRTLPKLPADIQEEFAAILSPAALAIIVGVLAVWAGSHYVGIGFIVDAILLIGGVIFLGWQIWSAASDLMSCLELTYDAKSVDDLDRAAKHLSNFIAVVGVAAFIALVTRGAGKRIKAKTGKLKSIVRTGSAKIAGMVPAHFQAVRQLAMSGAKPRVILFRATNKESVKYISKGFPSKPREIKVKTADSGIATCGSKNPAKFDTEVAKVRGTVDPVSGKKYYTVDKNGKTATNGDGDVINLNTPDWPVEPGQVIDPTSKKPIVGDYDLFDVFDPQILAGNQPANQGNMVLATSNGKFVDDFTNPEIRQVVGELNEALGSRRVMHGHHGAFGSIDNLDIDEVVTAFLPDGTVLAMNRAALSDFYKQIGRSTLDLERFLPK